MKLYSFGPGANSLKPLLALYEKELEFESVFLNPAKFEHHSDWYKKLNPNGQVPALEHNGKIVTESTVICEYLEDEFPDQNPLRPADNFERAQMRIWTKWVDEYFCWCVSTIGWHRMVGNMVKPLSDEEFEAMVDKVPIHEQKVKWRRAREGFPQDLLDEEMRKIGHSVKKLEARLKESKWLACDQYTLADICNFAIANGMQHGFPEFVNEKDTPAILDWLGRINDRPAAKKMFANQPSEFNRKKD
ncbi:glutathione S-transferase family protein [Marinicaulis aureus]|uniref:Glutathione S-transferase family protein n=1 Tax=Hyphococcus aureus TaxID=2666033 RepID=A0ABW1L1X9_9PROT